MICTPNHENLVYQEIPLSDYIDEKIRMLRHDFGIKLTRDQKAHLKSCTNEIQVDNAAHTYIFKEQEECDNQN